MSTDGKIGPIYIHKLANNLTGSNNFNLYQYNPDNPFNPTLRYDAKKGIHYNYLGKIIIDASGSYFVVAGGNNFNFISGSGDILNNNGDVVISSSGDIFGGPGTSRFKMVSQSGEIVDYQGNTVINSSGSYTGTKKRQAITTNYTTSIDDVFISITDTTSPRGIAISTTMIKEGREIIIKDEDGTANINNITIKGEGGETFDGSATIVINTSYGHKKLYCDGVNWADIT